MEAISSSRLVRTLHGVFCALNKLAHGALAHCLSSINACSPFHHKLAICASRRAWHQQLRHSSYLQARRGGTSRSIFHTRQLLWPRSRRIINAAPQNAAARAICAKASPRHGTCGGSATARSSSAPVTRSQARAEKSEKSRGKRHEKSKITNENNHII